MLNLKPNVMLVGLGGGYDIFTGLPIVYQHPKTNFTLVNSSSLNSFHVRLSSKDDAPEGFIEKENNIKNVYSVGRHGCQAVKSAYEHIKNVEQIDQIIAIDGGVDSLMTGDEFNSGTILEDFIAIAALKDIDKPKILCCAGFGTETEENVNHYRILENMANLAANDGFLGSFSLTKNMPEFQKYTKQCELAWADGKRKSHIQTKIISAVNGKFENQYKDVDPRVANSTGVSFISLLSSIYWLFDFDVVAKNNKAIETLKKSNTFADAKILLKQFLSKQFLRSQEMLPL